MWPDLTEETRERVMNAGQPAAALEPQRMDPTQHALFAEFLQANGASGEALELAGFLSARANAAEAADLLATYGEDGVAGIAWPEQIATQLSGAAQGLGTDSVLFAMEVHAQETLTAWWTAFADEVARMQSWAGRTAGVAEWSDPKNRPAEAPPLTEEQQASLAARPVTTTMTMDQLDRSYIDSVNEYNLKAVDEGGYVEYRFYNGILLVGPETGSFAPAYLQVFEYQAETVAGHNMMKSKGGTFSSGEIVVRNFTGDQAAFKTALRRFSKKNVSYA
jgi:hypothetical protein